MGQRPTHTSADVSYGQRLRQARKNRGLTQAELGQMVGLPQSMVAQYEGGYIRLHASLITAFSAALGVSLSELLGGKTTSAPAIKNRSLLRRLHAVDRLPIVDQKALVRFLDALLLRQAAATTGSRQSRQMAPRAAKRSRAQHTTK